MKRNTFRETYGRLFCNHSFMLLFGGQCISWFGDILNTIAIMVLAYRLTGSGLAVGGAIFSTMIPWIVLSPLAGYIADRIDRRRVMVAADFIRAAIVLMFIGCTSLWQLLVLNVLRSAVSVFFEPAMQAALPNLTGSEHVAPANSAMTAASNLLDVAGPGLAGVVVAAVGTRAAFALNAASFAISGFAVWSIRARFQVGAAKTTRAVFGPTSGTDLHPYAAVPGYFR